LGFGACSRAFAWRRTLQAYQRRASQGRASVWRESPSVILC